MNEIVMYNNELNTIILPDNFSDTELRVFWAIVSRLRDRGSEEVTFRYSYLKELTKEKKHYTKQQYSELIQNIYHKLIGLRFAYSNEEVVGEVNLFQSYEKQLSDESFTISVSPKFQYIFNQLTTNGSYTAWNLSQFCDLPGVYTKQLYRLLKQWKYVGHASFLLKDLRQYMGVPESYETKEVTRRVLSPAVSKLIMYTDEFKELKFEYSSRGTKAIRVKFSWKPEARKAIAKKDESNNEDSDEGLKDNLSDSMSEASQPSENSLSNQKEEGETEQANPVWNLNDFGFGNKSETGQNSNDKYANKPEWYTEEEWKAFVDSMPY